MLEATVRVEFIMSGQVDLAILADNPGVGIGQDLSVEMLSVRCQFRIAKRYRNAVIARALEQRCCCNVGHFSLEPAINLGLILKIPAWEKSGQAKFGKDDELATGVVGLIQQSDHT